MIVAAVVALVALGFAAALVRAVLSAGKGTKKMQEIAGAVQEGAQAYLLRQFKTLGIFVVIAVVVLYLLPVNDVVGSVTSVKIGRSLFFIVGAVFSAFIGGAGMALATRANVRVRGGRGGDGKGRRSGSREKAMQIAFRTGGVVGFLTVGLGLLGATMVVLIYRGDAPTVLEGFGFGAALLAMFMRVGGGIFTKAADVGADLVGKVEQGIPEDDPRNAATIADNVGDNVGDCAGMAADLFESYAVTLVAALILGRAAWGTDGLVFPLITGLIGVLVAIVGVFITRLRPSDKSGMTAINRAFYISAVVSAILVAIASFVFLPATFAGVRSGVRRHHGQPALDRDRRGRHRHRARRDHPGADRLLHRDRPPAGEGHRQGVRDRRGDGHPGRHQRRLRVGRLLRAGHRRRRLRRVPRRWPDRPVRGGAGRLRPADHGRRDRGHGHLRPDLRQRAGHRRDVRRHRQGRRPDPHRPRRRRQHHQGDHQGHRDRDRRTGRDRAVRLVHEHGRERAAVGRLERRRSTALLNVSAPKNIVGLLIGAAVVFLFSGLAINAVSRSAMAVVFEVRRQFKTFPGIMDGTQRPEYGKVVDICTRDAQRELLTPGLLAIMAPIAVGFGLGAGALASYLAGAIGAGTLMALFLANSGGAWDNAKKMVEDGAHGGKGSPAARRHGHR